jgi:regulator of cell morphogenesis and NO signaling
LASLALGHPARADVLDRHHLDFCCRGKRTLREACEAAHLDLPAVLHELADAAEPAPEADPPVRWDEQTLPALVDHIVDTHHAYTRAAFTRIAPLMAKVVGHHAGRHPVLQDVQRLYQSLVDDLGPHLLKEEQILFPFVRMRALADGLLSSPPPFETVANPVRRMLFEHESAGDILAELVAATHDFEVPPDGCTGFHALYAALADLRRDLLVHISLENNLLFPRVLAEEEAWRTGRPRSSRL